jgi:hypothetical protein
MSWTPEELEVFTKIILFASGPGFISHSTCCFDDGDDDEIAIKVAVEDIGTILRSKGFAGDDDPIICENLTVLKQFVREGKEND